MEMKTQVAKNERSEGAFTTTYRVASTVGQILFPSVAFHFITSPLISGLCFSSVSVLPPCSGSVQVAPPRSVATKLLVRTLAAPCIRTSFTGPEPVARHSKR